MPKITQKTEKAEKYFEAVGRRKTAVARVRIYPVAFDAKTKKGERLIVNDKNFRSYFPLKKQQEIAIAPFKTLALKNFEVGVKTGGGGLNAQAEAIRLGISRALVLFNLEWRPRLKTMGFLRRDPRMVERKKYGFRKARRPQQWRKR